MAQQTPHQITVTVVVATMPVVVNINNNQHVAQLIRDALHEAGKPSDKTDGWFLKAEQGQEFQPDQKISDAGIVNGMTLYLTQDAGGGGSQ